MSYYVASVHSREQLQLPSIPRSHSGPGRQVGIKVKVMLDRVTLDLVALIHQRWEQVPENQEAIMKEK